MCPTRDTYRFCVAGETLQQVQESSGLPACVVQVTDLHTKPNHRDLCLADQNTFTVCRVRLAGGHGRTAAVGALGLRRALRPRALPAAIPRHGRPVGAPFAWTGAGARGVPQSAAQAGATGFQRGIDRRKLHPLRPLLRQSQLRVSRLAGRRLLALLDLQQLVLEIDQLRQLPGRCAKH